MEVKKRKGGRLDTEDQQTSVHSFTVFDSFTQDPGIKDG